MSSLRRDHMVGIYWVSCAMFGLSTSIFDALYALHLRVLGLKEDQIGFVFGCGSAVMAVTLVVMIPFSKKLSAGAMLKWNTVLFATCMMIFPFLSTFPAHTVNFCICSVGSAIMMSTGSPAMLEHVPPPDRSRFYSLYFIVFLLSSAIGTSLIALMQYVYGAAAGLQSFTGALILSGALSVAMALTRLCIRFTTGVPPQVNADGCRQKQSFLNTAFYFTFVISFFTGASAVLSIRFVNLLLVERLHLTVDQTLLWLTAERLICFVTLIFLAERIKTGNQYTLSAVLMVLSGLFLASASFTLLPAVFGILYLARQAAHYSQQPLLEQISFEGVLTAERGQAGFIRRLGMFLGSSLGAFFYGRLIADGAAAGAMLLASGFAALAAAAYALRAFGMFRPAQSTRAG